MEGPPTRILLVEDNPGDARLIREMLAEAGYGDFEIEAVPRLAPGLARLARGGIDAVLLDLGLPDSQGLETFIKTQAQEPHLPVVVLTGLADEALGLKAVRLGAQDYLVKDKVDGSLLARALRYAIERQQVQDALRAERRRLYSLLDGLPAFVYLKAPDYTIRFANRGFRELFGDPEGRHCYEVVPGGDKPCENCPSFQELETQTYYKWELTRPGKDRTYQVYNYPFADIDGSPLVLTLGIDITERKEAEKALKESEESFRQIFENAADAFFLHDKGKIIEVNQEACHSLGYSKAELVRMSVPDFEVGLSREALMERWEYNDASAPIAGIHRRRDGSTFPVEVRAGEIIYHGRKLRLAAARDVTERQRAEEALRQSELKYRTLVVSAPFGISIIGRNGHYKYLNPKFEEMFGYTLRDISTGRDWFAQAYPDPLYRWEVIADWKREFDLLQMREARPKTFRVRCKDGTAKVINFRAVGLSSGDCLMFYEDITQRVQAEEALTQSELKYRNLVEQIPAITYTAALDEASSTLFVSPQIKAMLGVSPEDYESAPDTWRKHLHPQDRDRVLTDLSRCHESGEPFVSEYRMVAKNGRIVWFRDEARSVHRVKNLPPFLQGVMLDITKRKELEEALRESEEQYRLLVNQIPAVVFKGYADGRVEFFDQKIESLIGYKKEDFDADRLRWTDLIVPEDAPAARESLLKALKGSGSYVREHRIRKPDGEILWIQCRGQIFCNDAGRIDHISGVFFDISERRRAEEALKESEQALRLLTARLLTAQESERKSLSQGLHDELGHALLTLKLHLRSLEKQLLPEQEDLAEDVDELLQYIDEVIDNVRRLYLDLTPGDLEDLGLTAAVQNLIEDFGKHHGKIEWSVNLDNIDACFATPAQTAIYRIFQEILTNIGKHADPSQVSVAINREGETVCFEVTDNGVGFEVEGVRKRSAQQGMGLLALEERVRMLGGTLQLWSQVNQGTRISFALPVAGGQHQ